MLIVGAGTATCPILEEQAGHGNNFNLLDFDVERNEVAIRVHRANGEGKFIPVDSGRKFSIFRTQPLGYTLNELRKIADVDPGGFIRTQVVKDGLRIEREDMEIAYIDLDIQATLAASEISNFSPDQTFGKFKPDFVDTRRVEGRWFLETPLKRRGGPVSLSYSYVLKNGAAMTPKQHLEYYGRERSVESTSVIIKNPTARLKLELQLPAVPKRFKTEVFVEVEHMGPLLPPERFGCRLKSDAVANRCVLEVDHPPQDHKFSLVWRLPDQWD